MKSIGQLHTELKDAKEQFQTQLKQLELENLSPQQDFKNRHNSIESILKLIPPEDTLKRVLNESENHDEIQNRLLSYSGPYEIIRKAAECCLSLKEQSRSIYSLAAQINLPRLPQDIKFLENPIIQTPLMSQRIILEKKQRSSRGQRNTITQSYFLDLRKKMNPQCLPYDQSFSQNELRQGALLTHVQIYDSIKGQKQHQYVFLGDQKLVQLRNLIYCVVGELEKHEKGAAGGFLLVEGVFYTHGGAKVTAEVNTLIQHLELTHTVKFSRFDMAHTCFKDLRVVFGRTYLYRHFGGCDHQIVFRESRLFSRHNPLDEPSISMYPLMVYEGRFKRRRCEGCEVNFAVCVSLADTLKKGHNLYLCEGCFKKISESQTNALKNVVPYIHD